MARTLAADDNEKEREDRKTALAFFDGPYDEAEPGHRPYINKDRRGRPTVMTTQVLLKLEAAYKIGCPDREACIFAGISTTTLYEYCKKHPEFAEQKEDWKEEIVIASRAVVNGAVTMRQSVPDAWAILKHKRKQEFGDKRADEEQDNALTLEDLEAAANGQIEINNEQIIDGQVVEDTGNELTSVKHDTSN